MIAGNNSEYALDSRLFPQSARSTALLVPRHTPDLSNFNRLHVLEKAQVKNAVAVRRAEFGDARWCAHQSLRKLGPYDHPAILRGERGMPLWPVGIAGSLTHTEGLRAAVVAPTTEVASMGIDAEIAEELPGGILGSIARPNEIAMLDDLRARGLLFADRLLFCAKEATYKAWFPITQRWLDFDQAEIDIRADGTFISYLLIRPTPFPFIEGKWAIHDGYVVATTVIPAMG
ncbi:4'-phosphopantetheinyl transferase family protein [Corynebacterium diphtheriae]